MQPSVLRVGGKLVESRSIAGLGPRFLQRDATEPSDQHRGSPTLDPILGEAL